MLGSATTLDRCDVVFGHLPGPEDTGSHFPNEPARQTTISATVTGQPAAIRRCSDSTTRSGSSLSSSDPTSCNSPSRYASFSFRPAFFAIASAVYAASSACRQICSAPKTCSSGLSTISRRTFPAISVP